MTEPWTSDNDGKIYVTPAYFELDRGRSHRTVRAWIRTGQARSMWRDSTLYVHFGDALRLHKESATQPRKPRQRRAA